MYQGHVQLSPASRGTATKGNNMYVSGTNRTARSCTADNLWIECKAVKFQVNSVFCAVSHGTHNTKGQLPEDLMFCLYTCVYLEPRNVGVYSLSFTIQCTAWHMIHTPLFRKVVSQSPWKSNVKHKTYTDACESSETLSIASCQNCTYEDLLESQPHIP